MTDKIDQDLFPVRQIIDKDRQEFELYFKRQIESSSNYQDESYLKDQLNINDNYLTDKTEFKNKLLPGLLDSASLMSDTRVQSSALLILQIILFKDQESGKSKLSIKALNASLIEKLISINETKEPKIKELVLDFYQLLCLVVANHNKEVKKLLLSKDNLLIDSTIRSLNDSNNECIIKGSLIILQFYIYNSKKYDKISAVLSTLIKLLKYSDQSVIIQSLQTILIFSQSFRESRRAIIESNVCKKLLNLWSNSEDEQLIRPIFAIIKTLLPRLNEYKNHFLSTEINILEIIPKLVNSNELNKIFVTQIVKMIAMKPINAQNYSSDQQINKLINYKTIEQITNLLEFDQSFAVKSGALQAIFNLVYNAKDLDQLKQLAEQGCLKALCSQLGTDDENHLKVTVLSIGVFLLEEVKAFLKEQKRFPKPKELTPFAKMIRECEGFTQLNHLNRVRLQKEEQKNSGIPDYSIKEIGYKTSDTEKMIEEIMVRAFGEGSYYKTRGPSIEVMSNNQSTIVCCDCKSAAADTTIFNCDPSPLHVNLFVHITYCRKCAASAVHKAYSGDVKKCVAIIDRKGSKCDKSVAIGDCPFHMFKSKLFKEYKTQQDELEKQIHPEILK